MILGNAIVVVGGKGLVVLVDKRNQLSSPVIGCCIVGTLIVESKNPTRPIAIDNPLGSRLLRDKQLGIFVIHNIGILELIPITHLELVGTERQFRLGQHAHTYIAGMSYPQVTLLVKGHHRHTQCPIHILRKRRVFGRIMAYTLEVRKLVYALEPGTYVESIGIIGIECHVVARV